MIDPWQVVTIHIVIAVVGIFIMNLYAYPKDEDEVARIYIVSIFWPLSLAALATATCFFVIFVLPARVARWCHRRTTPPEIKP